MREIMKIRIDDTCCDIYINDELKYKNLGKYNLYDKFMELLTETQFDLFLQGEREF